MRNISSAVQFWFIARKGLTNITHNYFGKSAKSFFRSVTAVLSLIAVVLLLSSPLTFAQDTGASAFNLDDVGAGLPVNGAADNWQVSPQKAFSPVAEQIRFMHDKILVWIYYGIAALILVLLLIIVIRFRESKNKTPSKVSHNSWLEVVWTTLPALILLIIFIPSLKLLKATELQEEADLTIKITGRQWYWSYDYPDNDDIAFDSFMLPEETAIAEGKRRLMDTDNPLVVPAGKNIRFIITSSDVLHSWAVPAFGIKMDAVPGRLNETWALVNEPGIYYGFCTELCGQDHSYMPIHVVALEASEFEKWVIAKQESLAINTKQLGDSVSSDIAFKN